MGAAAKEGGRKSTWGAGAACYGVWSSRGEEEAREEREDDVVMMEVREGGEVGGVGGEGIDEAFRRERNQ
jgi:hypothetical protein